MRFIKHVLACVLTAMLVAGAAADPPGIELRTDRAALMSAAEWTVYSDRISDALTDENLGVRTSALRMTVLYADRLELDRSDVFEIARTYRDDPDDRIRRLAVVALNALDDDWGIDLLARSYRFEKCPAVKHTIAATLLEHAKRHRMGIIEVGEPYLVWPVN